MLGGSEPWGFFEAEGTACFCLLTPSLWAGPWKLSQLLSSRFPFCFSDFCMCGVWNPGDCLWSLVGVWKCVRTSSLWRYDVQKCAFSYPAAWFKWLQSLTETLPLSLATLWLIFHRVNVVLSKPKVSIKFLEKEVICIGQRVPFCTWLFSYFKAL